MALAQEARQKYDRGDWDGARQLFEAANDKAHSPVLTLYVARCFRNAGQLLRARAVFQEVVNEVLPSDANQQFRAANKDAADDLSELERRIPRLAIAVVGGHKTSTVDLDGTLLSTADLAQPVWVDPGARVVRLLSDGVEVARRAVVAEEGKVVPVELSAPPPAGGPPKAAPSAPAASSEESGKPLVAEGSLLPGLLTMALGATVGAVGVGTRVVAFDKIDGVRSRCVGSRCLGSDEAEVRLAENLQTASTVCLVVGGAALAAGVVVTIVRPGGSSSPGIALQVRPGWMSVEGSFQ